VSFEMTREAANALAEHVLSAARYASTGRIGLRATPGGFGTPLFTGPDGQDRRIRCEGNRLVIDDGFDVILDQELTTLGAAAEAVGIELGAPEEVYEPTTDAEPYLDLRAAIAPDAARALAEWYQLGDDALEALRAENPVADPPSEVQLWPEHFDLAVDLGSEADGTRVTFGASPGDEPNPEPYLYVLPWREVERGGFWNAASFTGAILGSAEVWAAPIPLERALAFFQQGNQEVLDAARN
jgi:hypothetical protein